MFGKVEGARLINWSGVSSEVEEACLINIGGGVFGGDMFNQLERCVCQSDEARMRNATNCGRGYIPVCTLNFKP